MLSVVGSSLGTWAQGMSMHGPMVARFSFTVKKARQWPHWVKGYLLGEVTFLVKSFVWRENKACFALLPCWGCASTYLFLESNLSILLDMLASLLLKQTYIFDLTRVWTLIASNLAFKNEYVPLKFYIWVHHQQDLDKVSILGLYWDIHLVQSVCVF